MVDIGQTDYRNGAKERLKEDGLLLRQELFSGCIYLAGRAVEGMLRAMIWKGDCDYALGKKTLNTGHNLREMLKLVGNLGLLRESVALESLKTDVQKVGRLWWNNMRFCSTLKISKVWRGLGEVDARRTIKKATAEYFDACTRIIRMSERILWQSN